MHLIFYLNIFFVTKIVGEKKCENKKEIKDEAIKKLAALTEIRQYMNMVQINQLKLVQ